MLFYKASPIAFILLLVLISYGPPFFFSHSGKKPTTIIILLCRRLNLYYIVVDIQIINAEKLASILQPFFLFSSIDKVLEIPSMIFKYSLITYPQVHVAVYQFLLGILIIQNYRHLDRGPLVFLLMHENGYSDSNVGVG